MSDSNLTTWSESINRAVYNHWVALPHRPASGFQVFCSPVRANSDLIISRNPGGGADSFQEDLDRFQRGDFSLPLSNYYVSRTDWRRGLLPRAMKRFFQSHPKRLETAIPIRSIFFRSKDFDELQKLPDYRDIRYYCMSYWPNYQMDLIKVLNPRAILLVGLEDAPVRELRELGERIRAKYPPKVLDMPFPRQGRPYSIIDDHSIEYFRRFPD